jgi:periplasmic protein TonB
MTNIINLFSPKSSTGSFAFSIAAHVLLYVGLVTVLGLGSGRTEIKEEYLDLGYQTFDEPPVPEQEERKVVRSPEPTAPVDPKAVPDDKPHELQDEKGEVAGTQAAVKENNIGSTSNGTAASTPYYKIKPKYPKAALVAGVEGWVLLQVDITESGEVENVRVVDGEQRNMFESEAKRAVAKYKYRPFTDNTGRPTRKADHQVRVDFRLVDEEAGG